MQEIDIFKIPNNIQHIHNKIQILRVYILILRIFFAYFFPYFFIIYRIIILASIYIISSCPMPTKKIYSNTIAQIGSKLITAVISIGLIKILTEYLGVAEYGIYSKIYNFLSIFAVIADLGLYTITVRELAENESHPEKMQKIANNVLTLRTLMGIGIIFLSIGIAFFLPGYDSHVEVIGVGIVAVFTLFGLINSSLMSYLQATLCTEFTLISTTSGKLLTFLLILALYLTISIFPLDQNE